MKKLKGNIWTIKPIDAWIVIPTNVGWKRDGRNVMGRGLAKQASIKYENLDLDYGTHCKKKGDELFCHPDSKIICIPSKSLNKLEPWLSWQKKSDTDLMKKSYQQLKELAETNPDMKIKVPLLGAGNGGIKKSDAMKLIEDADLPDNVFFVEYSYK